MPYILPIVKISSDSFLGAKRKCTIAHIGNFESKQQKFTSACQESVWIKLRPGAKNIQPI